MSQRDRIDPESRGPLEALLAQFPGGVNCIPDLTRRRQLDLELSLAYAPAPESQASVVSEDHDVSLGDGLGSVAVRVHRPVGVEIECPGIYFIHGGGMILGTLDSEDATARMLCGAVAAVVVSVDYRLAPEHPHPTPVEDCYAGLEWTATHAGELGIDPARLAIFGGSAGGGLAVATALLSRERGGPRVSFLMPIYPMLDDRNETASSHEVTGVGVWDRQASLEAWDLYLDGHDADQFAAPARAVDLRGLPPTFIDVGDVDLFRDEDIHFAARLMSAGVPTELHVYPGAYHASELIAPEAALSERIWEARIGALRRALHPGG